LQDGFGKVDDMPASNEAALWQAVLAGERSRERSGYYFSVDLKEALKRNLQRTGRAMIPAPGVVATFKRMQAPAMSEGFDELYSVTINERNEFVVSRHSEGGGDANEPTMRQTSSME